MTVEILGVSYNDVHLHLEKRWKIAWRHHLALL